MDTWHIIRTTHLIDSRLDISNCKNSFQICYLEVANSYTPIVPFHVISE